MRILRSLLLGLCCLLLGLGASAARAQERVKQPDPLAERTWITPAVSAPRVTQRTFESSAAKTQVSYHLYTPAAYEREPERRVPVVYWLHGSGGGLPGIPMVARRFDEAIAAGMTPPCLVVLVNGLEMGMYVDWADGSAPMETILAKELVAHIDATLRTIATREGRLLDGYSMGGYGAARFGFKYPEMFRAVSIMGGGPLQPELTRTPRASRMQAQDLLRRAYGGDQVLFRAASPRVLAASNAATIARDSLVRVVIGDRDETYPANVEFHEHLVGLSIPHEWLVLPGVDHDPNATLEALGDRHWAFYRKAFGAESTSTPRANHAANGEILLDVAGAKRRALYSNAPLDDSKRPAVIVLHGGMGSAEQMRATSGFDATAKAHGFLVAYGEGLEFGRGRHAWNTGHLLRRQVRDADDVAYLDALLDRLIAEHGADPARIHMTGGSNGGMMTFVYATRRAERLAAIAPIVASMFSFDATPSAPLPILMINGAKDDEVPIDGGMSRNELVRSAQASPFKPLREVIEFWVKANKSVVESSTSVAGTLSTTTHAAGEGGAVTVSIVDSEGGHGWPGTPARRGGSNPIQGLKGAERAWAFFADKSRPSAVRAPASIEVLDFADLVDAKRGALGPDGRPAGRVVPIRVHAPAGAGPFPLVIVSHGAGGDRDTHQGQAQDLAAHGYMVLCVEHVGSNRAILPQSTRLLKAVEAMTRDANEVLARPADISFALDQAAEWNRSHERLRERLDLGRIGVMGHSFGAYTTMVACGMRPALDWLVPPVAPGKGFAPDLHDARIACGVALSPQGVGEPFFLAESYASLRKPLLGITGSNDDQQGGQPATHRKDGFALWPAGEHRFLWLSNARHNDFTSASGATGAALPSPTRADAQPIVRAATRAFFDLHLKSDTTAAQRLSVEGLRPLLRGEIDAVEVLVKQQTR